MTTGSLSLNARPTRKTPHERRMARIVADTKRGVAARFAMMDALSNVALRRFDQTIGEAVRHHGEALASAVGMHRWPNGEFRPHSWAEECRVKQYEATGAFLAKTRPLYMSAWDSAEEFEAYYNRMFGQPGARK